MIRTLVVIVACLVVSELAFGEADARLCYNAQQQLCTDLTGYEIRVHEHRLPSEMREHCGDYRSQACGLINQIEGFCDLHIREEAYREELMHLVNNCRGWEGHKLPEAYHMPWKPSPDPKDF